MTTTPEGTPGMCASPSRVIIAEFPKNAQEIVRVALDEYKGVPVLDIRAWYAEGTKPGKGITMHPRNLTTLRKALQAAEAAMRQRRSVEFPEPDDQTGTVGGHAPA